MKLRWITGPAEANETFVLLAEVKRNLITEWRVAGYVMLRQVYPRLPATYHVFQIDLEDELVNRLGAFAVLNDAKVRLSRAVIERA